MLDSDIEIVEFFCHWFWGWMVIVKGWMRATLSTAVLFLISAMMFITKSSSTTISSNNKTFILIVLLVVLVSDYFCFKGFWTCCNVDLASKCGKKWLWKQSFVLLLNCDLCCCLAPAEHALQKQRIIGNILNKSLLATDAKLATTNHVINFICSLSLL